MKKKLVALLSLILALMMVFSACGGTDYVNPDSDEDDDESDSAATTEKATENEETQGQQPDATTPSETPTTPSVDDPTTPSDPIVVPEPEPEPVVPQFPTSNRVDLVYNTTDSVSSYNGGLVYRDSTTSKYGIKSFDGKHDSGAIYYNVDAIGPYFKVTTEQPAEAGDVASVNKTGLVDSKGNVLIPTEYGVVKELTNDERFFRVIKATEQTTSEDDTLMYITSKLFTLEPGEDDVRYKGQWFIYDLQTGSTIPGVTGTKAYSVNIYYDVITYGDDLGNKVYVNTRGQAFPDGAKRLSAGNYYLDSAKAVYDAFGNKLFDYDEKVDGTLSFKEDCGYYVCAKYQSGGTKYRILNSSGKVVVSDLTANPYVYADDLMIYNKKLCDFAGNQLLSVEVDSVMKYGPFWYVRSYTTKDIFLFDENKQLVFSGNSDAGDNFHSVDWTLEQNGKYYDFTIGAYVHQGSSLGHGMVTVTKADDTKDLIDTLTGETVLSGFTRYYIETAADGTNYIAAYSRDLGNVIYKLK